ncbi:MAG: hypothetical protein MZW92_33875 [Comamonadaceae bacterium]|nr:hypothetical protein [Comamonadaceae bacterium]
MDDKRRLPPPRRGQAHRAGRRARAAPAAAAPASARRDCARAALRWLGAGRLGGCWPAAARRQAASRRRWRPSSRRSPAARCGARSVGGVGFPLVPAVRDGVFHVAGGDGDVLALAGRQRRAMLWRASAGARLSAGVGSDGRFTSVVTRGNEVVTFDGGRELLAQAPAVARGDARRWWPASASS